MSLKRKIIKRYICSHKKRYCLLGIVYIDMNINHFYACLMFFMNIRLSPLYSAVLVRTTVRVAQVVIAERAGEIEDG